MPTFSDLPEHLGVTRRLGIDAENALHTAPLLSLLRARQILEVWLDDRRIDHSPHREGFKGDWQNVLHARHGVLNPSLERRAAMAALRLVFRKVAGPEGGHWTRPRSQVAGADHAAADFAELQARYEDLEDRLRAGTIQVDVLKRELHSLDVATRKLEERGTLDQDQADALRLYRYGVGRAWDNHAGKPWSPPPPDVEDAIERALQTPGLAQRLALEQRNRDAISLVNAYRFDEAFDRLEDLVERYAPQSELTDETIGALLGSAGQAAGFLSFWLGDPDIARQAATRFAQARRHFLLDADLERQDAYLLHALSSCVALGDPAARDELVEQLEVLAPRVDAWASGQAGLPRTDYLLAAWLKAHHALGRPVERYASLVERWLKELPEDAVPAGAAHGSLLATAWLAVTTPGSQRPPRRLQAFIDELAGRVGGLLAWVARVFQAQLAWRAGEAVGPPGPPPVEAAQRWWDTYDLDRRWAAACQPAGRGPVSVLPFNFG